MRYARNITGALAALFGLLLTSGAAQADDFIYGDTIRVEDECSIWAKSEINDGGDLAWVKVRLEKGTHRKLWLSSWFFDYYRDDGVATRLVSATPWTVETGYLRPKLKNVITSFDNDMEGYDTYKQTSGELIPVDIPPDPRRLTPGSLISDLESTGMFKTIEKVYSGIRGLANFRVTRVVLRDDVSDLDGGFREGYIFDLHDPNHGGREGQWHRAVFSPADFNQTIRPMLESNFSYVQWWRRIVQQAGGFTSATIAATSMKGSFDREGAVMFTLIGIAFGYFGCPLISDYQLAQAAHSGLVDEVRDGRPEWQPWDPDAPAAWISADRDVETLMSFLYHRGMDQVVMYWRTYGNGNF